MREETRALVIYRSDRARESLEEANVLLDKGYGNTFVNRLYYACFYAVSALLLSRGLSSAKHSGVRSLFHQNFIKPGLVEVELGHETFAKRPLLANLGVRLEFQSSKYSIYSCG